jgi:hypothetical protein
MERGVNSIPPVKTNMNGANNSVLIMLFAMSVKNSKSTFSEGKLIYAFSLFCRRILLVATRNIAQCTGVW